MNFDFPTFLVLACLVTGGIWLADAVLLAPRRKRLAREAAIPGGKQGAAEGATVGYKEPILVEYSRSFFPVILIVLLLRSFLVEPFRIPSNSMMPTLLTGDFILVNKFAYGLRWPVLNKKFVQIDEPQRGDVIVFRYPQDPTTDYIKRVVGVPGDEIDYRNKTLYVNGAPARQTPFGTFLGVGSGKKHTGALLALEDLNGVEHKILISQMAPDLAPTCMQLSHGPVEVPAGAYFAMGDNRDASSDSRCWGFVPDENLVGKAFAIWMNWDSELDGFPVDWGRLGNRIR
jgi:signal peptidase I